MVDTDTSRSHVAAEVLELGQTLFDTLVEVAEQHEGSAASRAGGAATVEELRAASETFFRALRLLLGLADHDTSSAAPPAIGDEPPASG